MTSCPFAFLSHCTYCRRILRKWDILIVASYGSFLESRRQTKNHWEAQGTTVVSKEIWNPSMPLPQGNNRLSWTSRQEENSSDRVEQAPSKMCLYTAILIEATILEQLKPWEAAHARASAFQKSSRPNSAEYKLTSPHVVNTAQHASNAVNRNAHLPSPWLQMPNAAHISCKRVNEIPAVWDSSKKWEETVLTSVWTVQDPATMAQRCPCCLMHNPLSKWWHNACLQRSYERPS